MRTEGNLIVPFEDGNFYISLNDVREFLLCIELPPEPYHPSQHQVSYAQSIADNLLAMWNSYSPVLVNAIYSADNQKFLRCINKLLKCLPEAMITFSFREGQNVP